jgi:molybdopterin-guanine dinucleotide biosynthesis protein A
MGQPKFRLPFGGEALLLRVVRVLSMVTAPVVVVAAQDQDLPPLPSGVMVARDAAEDRGPLQGMKAGLEAIGTAADAVFVAPTDAPFLEPAFVRRLALLRTMNDDVVMARIGGRTHPLSALYATTVAPVIDALLAEDDLAVKSLTRRLRTLIVEEARLLEDSDLRAVDPELRSLRNVNTQDEYLAALAELEGTSERE